ncbi:MAG: hypothetical protein EOO38_29025, partial [Cytophagaceae bacterium]
MSGIEVVGIVLGALPLAISLFQSYEDLAAAKNRLRDFEKLYRNIQRDLEHEELLFRLIVETLIRPLVNDEMIDKDDLDRIINNIDDSSWANQDISEALQQRLGEVHEPFIEVMKDTEQQCMQLLKSIGFDKPDIVSSVTIEVKPDAEPWWPLLETLVGPNRSAVLAEDFTAAWDQAQRLGHVDEPVVNTTELGKPGKTKAGSVAAMFDTSHEAARAYLDHLYGDLVAVDKAKQLDKHPRALSKDGWLKDPPLRLHLLP